MGVKRVSAAAVLGAAILLAGACTSPGSGGGGTTTTTTVGPDDPHGRYVEESGVDAGTCSASATPCATVQYATDQAVDGDTVYVSDGSYPEVVIVDKNLDYLGANAGNSAGVGAGFRGAESVVQGFRNPGNPGTVSYDVTIDGFRIDPQGDAGLIAASAAPLVWLRGGTSSVTVTNNVFNGGPFAGDCAWTCTTMTDFAFTVQSGTVDFSDNAVQNFRRPVNINQRVDGPVTNASVVGNAFSGITSRAISLAGATGVQMPGQVVSGNTIDATGITSASTPAGMTVSNGGNTISDNTFTGLSSGVYLDLCKKFITDDNSITGNTFNSNAAGININVNTDGGQCVSSATEGSGGWVTGGGRIDGLVVSANNFVGNTSYAIRHAAYNWDYWNPTAPAVSTGPIDVSCNWWSSATGPAAVDVHAYGAPFTPVADQLVYATAPHPAFTYSSWLTAPAPGGSCDGV